MTKAEEFSKQRQDALERQKTAKGDLTEIKNNRPACWFGGVLYASVRNDGNLDINSFALANDPFPMSDSENALKFVKWIQDIFGSNA